MLVSTSHVFSLLVNKSQRQLHHRIGHRDCQRAPMVGLLNACTDTYIRTHNSLLENTLIAQNGFIL